MSFLFSLLQKIFLWSLCGGVCWLVVVADIQPTERNRDRDRDDEEVIELAAPRLRNAEATVHAGEWVDIVLRPVRGRSSTLQFQLVQQPELGRVVQIVPDLEGEGALLRFDATEVQTEAVVEFQVQATRKIGGPSSAPATIRVRIFPPMQRVFVPDQLHFDEVFFQGKSVALLNLENTSRQVVEVSLRIEGQGFSWENSNQPEKTLTLSPVSSTDVPVLFSAGNDAEVYRGKVIVVSSAGEQEVPLFAEVSSEFEVRVDSLMFVEEEGQGEVLQPLQLENKSDQPLQLSIAGGEQLGLPSEVHLQALEQREIDVVCAPELLRLGGQGTVVIASSRRVVEQNWQIEPAPALAILKTDLGESLQPKELIDFGVIEVGESAQRSFLLQNQGGKHGFVQMKCNPPFMELWDEQLRKLEVDGELLLELVVEGNIPGVYEEVFSYGLNDFSNELVLRVEVVAKQVEEEENLEESATSEHVEEVLGQAVNTNTSSQGQTRSQLLDNSWNLRLKKRSVIEFPIIVSWEEVTPKTLEMSWRLPPKRADLEQLNWELFWLNLSASNQRWQKIPVEVDVDTENLLARTKIEGLVPGAQFTLRITATNPIAQKKVADVSYPIMMPLAQPWWPKVLPWLLGVAFCVLVVGAIFYWRKRQEI